MLTNNREIDTPLEDFECEEMPFTLPGGAELLQLVANDPRFVVLDLMDSPEKMIVSRVGILSALLSANIKGAFSHKCNVSEAELFYLLGWPEIQNNAAVFKKIYSLGKPYGLISRTADDALSALPLGRFLHDIYAESPKKCANYGLRLACRHIKDEIIASSDLSHIPDLTESLALALKNVPDNEIKILAWRYGLGGNKSLTLEQIGKRIGVSRERVRQKEEATLKKISHHTTELPAVLIREFIRNSGRRVVTLNNPHIPAWEFLCGILGVPVAVMPKSNLCVFGISLMSLESAGWRDWNYYELFAGAAYPKLMRWHPGLVWEDNQLLRDQLIKTRIHSTNELDKVFIALQDLGRPGHYSEIAAVRNKLFPHSDQTDRNVHAHLGRMTDRVAYIGKKGMYGLKELGAIRSESHIHSQVPEILKRKYALLKSPLPFEVVLSEVRKERPGADANSVRMVLGLYAIKTAEGRWLPKITKKEKGPKVFKFTSKIARAME